MTGKRVTNPTWQRRKLYLTTLLKMQWAVELQKASGKQPFGSLSSPFLSVKGRNFLFVWFILILFVVAVVLLLVSF